MVQAQAAATHAEKELGTVVRASPSKPTKTSSTQVHPHEIDPDGAVKNTKGTQMGQPLPSTSEAQTQAPLDEGDDGLRRAVKAG